MLDFACPIEIVRVYQFYLNNKEAKGLFWSRKKLKLSYDVFTLKIWLQKQKICLTAR